MAIWPLLNLHATIGSHLVQTWQQCALLHSCERLVVGNELVSIASFTTQMPGALSDRRPSRHQRPAKKEILAQNFHYISPTLQYSSETHSISNHVVASTSALHQIQVRHNQLRAKLWAMNAWPTTATMRRTLLGSKF